MTIAREEYCCVYRQSEVVQEVRSREGSNRAVTRRGSRCVRLSQLVFESHQPPRPLPQYGCIPHFLVSIFSLVIDKQKALRSLLSPFARPESAVRSLNRCTDDIVHHARTLTRRDTWTCF